MKNMKKIVAILCAAVILFTSFGVLSVSAATAYADPVKPDDWTDANFETDVAYSFAFVGDTQFLTIGDYLLGTNKLQTTYKYIADTVDERKLAHVFVLGDMTDWGYRNDANLAGSYDTPITGEWDIVYNAITQLNDKVSYSLVRGNHDDYMLDDYFNKDFYTSQFDGFYVADSAPTYAGSRYYQKIDGQYVYQYDYSASRDVNRGDYVYWSGASKTVRKTTVANSYKTFDIAGTKYLFITIDYNPSDEVLLWVDSVLESHPDRKAIITTHSYLNGNGEVMTSDYGSTMYYFDNFGTQLWNEVLSQHENVFMIVSGHTGPIAPTYSYNTGVHGNEVLQVLVDPQAYDTREINSNGDMWEDNPNVQDTGMVLYMNFSKDGKRINFDYYSTLLGKFYKYTNHTIYIEADETVNEGKDTNLADLEKFGQKNTYLTHTITTAPKLDGKIDSNEYSFIQTTAANSVNNFEGALTEYFAHDDEYLYYAITIKVIDTENEKGEPKTMQINMKPNYDWINKSGLNSTLHWPRYRIIFGITEEGVLYKNSDNMLTSSWGLDTSHNMSKIRWNKDVFISGSRDTDTKVNTFEFKIRKAYLAENTPEKEIQAFGYFLHLNYNSEGKEVMHRLETNAGLQAELGTSMAMYQYMIFVNNPITTRTTASVRLSSTSSGLRFVSEVDTAQLNDFKLKYKDVQIGTLIAPTNLLDGKALTHNIGTVGKDYIDVVASVDKPYKDNDNGVTLYAGSIVNISEKNLERDFSAVGYIKLTDEAGNVTYYYSNVTSTRNVSDIAEEAYFDFKTTSQAEYTNLVTGDDDIAKGYYSPYTPGQRWILRSLIPDKTYKDPFGSDIF